MSKVQRCETLIMLVGGNPLPNYIAAVTLTPKRVVMLYTCETKRVRERLENLLKEKLYSVIIDAVYVSKDSARDIREKVARNVTPGAYLNYTGGTKNMAAQARLAFREEYESMGGGDDRFAFYVEESRELILYDNGYQTKFGEKAVLSLKEIAKLHEVNIKEYKQLVKGGPTQDDVRAIMGAELDKPGFLKRELKEFWNLLNHKDVSCHPLRPETLGISLSVDQIPGPDWPSKRLEVWKEFLNDKWLELWMVHILEQIVGDSPYWSVYCEIGDEKRPFEVDIVLVRGCRLHAISCTTSPAIKDCKLKLFEVGQRARQLGGDLARAALVTIVGAYGEEAGQSKVDQLQQDVASVWDAPNKPKVFGLADLREWFGYQQPPRLDSLKDWLDV
ncbi:MAG: hypothetical protein ACOX3Z_01465 [Bacillota bacterium]